VKEGKNLTLKEDFIMTNLDSVIRHIPCDQQVIIRDYFSGVHYASDTVGHVIAEILDYRIELRNADMYRISIEGNNIIAIDVLIV